MAYEYSAWSAVESEYTGNEYTRTITDGLLSDAVNIGLVYRSEWTSIVSETTGSEFDRTPSDVAALADATAKSGDYGRTYTRFALHDLIYAGDQIVRLVLNDMGIFDSMVRQFVAARDTNDVSGLADAITRERGRLHSDVLALADAESQAVDYGRVLTDIEQLPDTVIRACVFIRMIGEALGLSDEVTQAKILRYLGYEVGHGSMFGPRNPRRRTSATTKGRRL